MSERIITEDHRTLLIGGQGSPTIYAYQDSRYDGLLKVGYTTRNAQERVKEQYPVLLPNQIPYRIVVDEPAIRPDGSVFRDLDVHKALEAKGIHRENGEWFRCGVEDVLDAINNVKRGKLSEGRRHLNFGLRQEQEAAIEKTMAYFNSYRKDNKGKAPRMLWNAKMRFGKTFTTYQLALRMGWSKVLVLTFKPAVQSAWEEDLKNHVDFQGWQFISRDSWEPEIVNSRKNLVCFGSFQDYLGRTGDNKIKERNRWVHETLWDCVVLDEYHFGSWRDSAKELFESEGNSELKEAIGYNEDNFTVDELPISAKSYIYLSGTPFRAIGTGEFIEEQIFNWTYSDEQKAKQEFEEKHPDLPNPYASLPEMVMLTYQLPASIINIALQGEFDEFDLNEFFAAEGEGDQARFKYQNQVQSWLSLLNGQFKETISQELKLGGEKPPMPFSDVDLMASLNHTFWFLPKVNSCFAMRNLLLQPQNTFYHQYQIVVAAGNKAGLGVKALPPVKEAITDQPLNTKSITLSCGKLTTGVTVAPWGGILMLRNCSSPETYFQAAFRVQSPFVLRNASEEHPNRELVLKKRCYVFDFAPNRALSQIAEYSQKLQVDGQTDPEEKVAEFIKFLPVLAYDGSAMKRIDAAGILDMALSGTTGTLLAKRWQSALLVNVDNETLKRLIDNKEALEALMKIEGFRTLNKDIETIINKSEGVKNKTKKLSEEGLTPEEKKELDQEKKERDSLRKTIQEKLIKFATRIPIFMYLSEYRERSLVDVITKLEPGLFKRVTNLTVADFQLLVSLNVFNSSLMNQAVYNFKRYEDASLSYTGIDKHEGMPIGVYDTVIERD